MTKAIKFKFFPLNFSWVALHPEPIGVIFFIGGAFFGTFPTFFYRYLLRHLFNQGYTIIALPYRFTFRHWSVAISLVQQQDAFRKAIIDEAKHRHYDYQIYQEDPKSQKANYFWLGHSLGCKYIALLELLTDLEESNSSQQKLVTQFFGNCLPSQEQKHLQAALADVDLTTISLENQNSILMAPAIEGLESAIPFLRSPRFTGIKNFLNKIGLKVEPSQKETFCLIQQSRLFNLANLIAFEGDTRVAAPTVQWLQNNLDRPLVRNLEGKHLAPLGWINGDPQIAETVEGLLRLF